MHSSPTRRHISRAFVPLVLAGLVAGCVGQAGVRPSESSGGPVSASPTVPALALPGDPDTLLIGVRSVGGFVAASYRFEALPTLALYADGRLIEQGAVPAIYPGPLLPALLVRRLASAELQRILAAADAAGLRPVAPVSYPPHGVADAPDTVVSVWSPDGVRETSFGAFGIEQADVPAAEAAARSAAASFIHLLEETTGTGETAYVPSAARVIVRPYENADPAVEAAPVAWPLGARLADARPLIADAPSEGGCLVVSDEDLAAIWTLLEHATQATPFTQDGARYLVRVRPLLPDEAAGCGA